MKRLLLVVTAAAALWGTACGGGTSFVTPPPPVGKYSLASLNGTYAFVTSGEFFTNSLSATPLARTGSFTADGKGGITGGVEDVNAAGTFTPALSVTGGNYIVNADGRGTLRLNISANGVVSTISFGIVLTSTSDGLMIDETVNGNQISTGSGNFILQTGAPFTVGSAPRWVGGLRHGKLEAADVALMKNFQLMERVRLQFRAEAFNISNTPQYGKANTTFGAPTFGTITGTTYTTPRNLQFSMRLSF